MTSNIKFILFAFIIMTFSEGKSQSWQNFLLQNDFISFLFPKEPGLVRVRRMDRTKRIDNAKILDFVGLVERHGYPAEEHNVTTEDGYNLIIHRIPGSPLLDNNKGKKEIVFIQHGILASSDSWILRGPGKDLAFLLADQGYDVWLGNMRGNSYCRSHVNMTTYDPKFWQYSFHEVGTKDLPAMFNYIFNYTDQKDLYYIGHSMGTTSLFSLLSTKPEYNIKIKMAICLAPVAFWMEVTPTFNRILNSFPIVKEVLREREIYDILPQSLTTVTIARLLCNDNAMTQFICITILFFIVGRDPTQLNTVMDLLFEYIFKYIFLRLYFMISIVTDNFRSYDYGTAENYKRYKQKTPPSYDLEKITASMILFYAANDMVAAKQNVFELDKRLPNVFLIEKVPYEFFNHADYIWAINGKTLLYDRILELIQNFKLAKVYP
ncbi:LIP3 Lipase, partial [Acromyrmex charruanus]